MPRNKYPEQTVEKILDAAALLFTQKGYQNTTLQDIIDATKLSKGAVYHHSPAAPAPTIKTLAICHPPKIAC